MGWLLDAFNDTFGKLKNPDPQGPGQVIANTPGGPIRAPVARPEPPPPAPENSGFQKALRDTAADNPVWATHTDMPTTAHSSRQTSYEADVAAAAERLRQQPSQEPPIGLSMSGLTSRQQGEIDYISEDVSAGRMSRAEGDQQIARINQQATAPLDSITALNNRDAVFQSYDEGMLTAEEAIQDLRQVQNRLGPEDLNAHQQINETITSILQNDQMAQAQGRPVPVTGGNQGQRVNVGGTFGQRAAQPAPPLLQDVLGNPGAYREARRMPDPIDRARYEISIASPGSMDMRYARRNLQMSLAHSSDPALQAEGTRMLEEDRRALADHYRPQVLEGDLTQRRPAPGPEPSDNRSRARWLRAQQPLGASGYKLKLLDEDILNQNFRFEVKDPSGSTLATVNADYTIGGRTGNRLYVGSMYPTQAGHVVAERLAREEVARRIPGLMRDNPGMSESEARAFLRGQEWYRERMHGAHLLGTAGMNDIRRQLAAVFPRSQDVGAARVSGARARSRSEGSRRQGRGHASLQSILPWILGGGALIGAPGQDDQAEAMPRIRRSNAPFDVRVMPGKLRDPNVAPPNQVRLQYSGAAAGGLHLFNILDKNGEQVGGVEAVPVKYRGENEVWIEEIGAHGGKGTLGPKAIRNIFDQVLQVFPDSEWVGGFRISGARGEGFARGTGASPDLVHIKVSDLKKKLGITSLMPLLVGTSLGAALGIDANTQTAEAADIPALHNAIRRVTAEGHPRMTWVDLPEGKQAFTFSVSNTPLHGVGDRKVKTFNIWSVYFDEDKRGGGNFTKYFDSLEPLLKELGYKQVHLHAVENAGLKPFYESRGYTKDQRNEVINRQLQKSGVKDWDIPSYYKSLLSAGAAASIGATMQSQDAQAKERRAAAAALTPHAETGAEEALGEAAGKTPPQRESLGKETLQSVAGSIYGAAETASELAGDVPPGEPFQTLASFGKFHGEDVGATFRRALHNVMGRDLNESEKRKWQIISSAGMLPLQIMSVPFSAINPLLDRAIEHVAPQLSKEKRDVVANFMMTTLMAKGMGKSIGKGVSRVAESPSVKSFLKDTSGSMMIPGGGRGTPPGGPAGPAGAPPGGPAGPAAPRGPSAARALYNATAGNVRALLSPASVGRDSEAMAGIIRKHTGMAARFEEVTRAALGNDPNRNPIQNLTQNYERRVNDLPPPQQRDLLKYIEGRSAGVALPASVDTPQFRAVADEIRHAMLDRQTRLQAIPRTAQMDFIQDYISHFWQDDARLRQYRQWWEQHGMAGSSAAGHTRLRTIPTIEDGISYGLTPVTTNPIDMTLRYVEQMDRYIADHEIINEAENQGMVRWMPRGSPQIPPDWAPARGRMTERGDLVAVMPREVARVYNRWSGQGFKGEYTRPIYESIQRTSNSITALELFWAGYHATAMNTEAPISVAAIAAGEALGIPGQVARGNLTEALRLLGGSAKHAAEAVGLPAAGATIGTMMGGPVGGVAGLMLSGGLIRAARGHKLQQVYLGRSPASAAPAMRHITNLLTAAGGRAVGKKHAMREYEFSPMGNFFTQWKRLGIRGMGRDLARRINRPREMGGRQLGIGRYPLNAAVEAALQIGNIFETVSAPLFEFYIPKLKSGAFYDNMKAWLDANPTASFDDQLRVARKIWDSVDNRFGEMVQDNIFWDKKSKQLLMLAMRSYSWNMGTIREIGGGAGAMLRGGRGASIKSGVNYDPRIGYVIALPVITALMGSIYAYLKTGQAPQDYSPQGLLKELQGNWSPQTGGKVPGPGGRGQVDEKIRLPGYMGDVLGWMNDWQQEAANKVATAPRIAGQAYTGNDWRGDPIVTHLDPDLSTRIGDYLSYLFTGNDPQLGPIAIRNLHRGQKRGSNISIVEQMLGIRPASMYIMAPEQTRRAQEHAKKTAIKKKLRYEHKRDRQYDQTPTSAVPGATPYGGPWE